MKILCNQCDGFPKSHFSYLKQWWSWSSDLRKLLYHDALRHPKQLQRISEVDFTGSEIETKSSCKYSKRDYKTWGLYSDALRLGLVIRSLQVMLWHNHILYILLSLLSNPHPEPLGLLHVKWRKSNKSISYYTVLMTSISWRVFLVLVLTSIHVISDRETVRAGSKATLSCSVRCKISF